LGFGRIIFLYRVALTSGISRENSRNSFWNLTSSVLMQLRAAAAATTVSRVVVIVVVVMLSQERLLLWWTSSSSIMERRPDIARSWNSSVAKEANILFWAK
jgi:hypothetical protein